MHLILKTCNMQKNTCPQWQTQNVEHLMDGLKIGRSERFQSRPSPTNEIVYLCVALVSSLVKKKSLQTCIMYN